MKYKLRIKKSALKKINKMDKKTSAMLISWINKNLSNTDNPRIQGKQLKGSLKHYWRYRVGSYRIVADIKDDELIILGVDAAHRRERYNKNN